MCSLKFRKLENKPHVLESEICEIFKSTYSEKYLETTVVENCTGDK